MHTGSTRELDFALLDDLMLLHPRAVAGAVATVGRLQGGWAGPVVEYALHQQQQLGGFPPLDHFAVGQMILDLTRTIQQRGQFGLSSTSLDALPHEFSALPDCSANAPPLWRAFKQRLANAAHAAGFDKLTSKGLAGAFGELEDNARSHSQRPRSAIVGYRWCPGEFEMVVGDAGIGVLKSLRLHNDYHNLKDHGTALKTALSSGETRHGRGSGHGTGFDTVFRNLASMYGTLRFRSGDQSLELDGLSPELVNSKLRQRQHFQGFAISITCRPK